MGQTATTATATAFTLKNEPTIKDPIDEMYWTLMREGKGVLPTESELRGIEEAETDTSPCVPDEEVWRELGID